MPLNFTLMYKDRTSDMDDTDGDVASTSIVGTLLFTPAFVEGTRIPFDEVTGMYPRSQAGILDTDGLLKQATGGTSGIRLWANDPDFNLDRFQYRVSAPNGLTDLRGRPISFRDFSFDAPRDDRVVYLQKELPRPGQKFGRGRPGFSIAGAESDGATITLVLDDGSELPPVAMAESNSLSVAYSLTFGR